MNTRKELPVLCMVIPCYNEEEVLPVTAPMFREKLDSLSAEGLISDKSRVLFVNDGSKDRTWEIISNICGRDQAYKAKNFLEIAVIRMLFWQVLW